jgi:hypothetical protein
MITLEPFAERVTIKIVIDRAGAHQLQPAEVGAYRKIIGGRIIIVLDGGDLPANVPVKARSVILDADGNEWSVREDTPRLVVPRKGGDGHTTIFACPVERIYKLRPTPRPVTCSA